jgi:hypothetical protein
MEYGAVRAHAYEVAYGVELLHQVAEAQPYATLGSLIAMTTTE